MGTRICQSSPRSSRVRIRSVMKDTHVDISCNSCSATHASLHALLQSASHPIFASRVFIVKSSCTAESGYSPSDHADSSGTGHGVNCPWLSSSIEWSYNNTAFPIDLSFALLLVFCFIALESVPCFTFTSYHTDTKDFFRHDSTPTLLQSSAPRVLSAHTITSSACAVKIHGLLVILPRVATEPT